jgi:hypothetical protein
MSTAQNVLIKISAASFACATIAVLTLAVSPSRAAPNDHYLQLVATAPLATPEASTQAPQERFAGAPDGVDPIVTGPVSASFRKRQIALDCDHAVWPSIPAGCYPE